jgi:hypothetical protein
MHTGSFPKMKRRGVNHPPSSSAEVKERVELYFSPSGPSRPVVGWALTAPLPYIIQLACAFVCVIDCVARYEPKHVVVFVTEQATFVCWRLLIGTLAHKTQLDGWPEIMDYIQKRLLAETHRGWKTSFTNIFISVVTVAVNCRWFYRWVF